MTPEAEAFERCIKENPGASTPRLAYADWCDDHNDPEFAEALRQPAFAGLVRWSAESGWGLRAAWAAAESIRAAGLALASLSRVTADRLIDAVRSSLTPAALAALGFSPPADELSRSMGLECRVRARTPGDALRDPALPRTGDRHPEYPDYRVRLLRAVPVDDMSGMWVVRVEYELVPPDRAEATPGIHVIADGRPFTIR